MPFCFENINCFLFVLLHINIPGGNQGNIMCHVTPTCCLGRVAVRVMECVGDECLVCVCVTHWPYVFQN